MSVYRTERYVNFYTDYGFKRLFGSEPTKHLLMDFLNSLMEPLKGDQKIVALTYLKNEHLGQSEEDRRAVYDINCVTDRGEQFIIELQRLKQRYFKKRALYYAAMAICEQAQTGRWNFSFRPIYVVSIMDFTLDGVLKEPSNYRHDVTLREAGMEEPFDEEQVHFTYLEMPKFNKKSSELESHFEKWIFAMKNLSKLDQVPEELRERIFEEFFQAAEVAKMSPQDQAQYDQSRKVYLDNINTLDYATDQARERGHAEGLEKGLAEGLEKGLAEGLEKGIAQGEKNASLAIAKKLLAQSLPLEAISAATGLSCQDLQALKEKP